MEEKRPSISVRFVPYLIAILIGVAAAWSLRGGQFTERAGRSEAGQPTQAQAMAPTAAGALLSLDPPAASPAAFSAPSPASPLASSPSVPTAAVAEPAPAASAPPPEEQVSAVASVPREKLRFQEIWSYLMPGEERLWSERAPITDVGLFDFKLDVTGRLQGRANTRGIEIASQRGIRTHLVVATSGNQSLFHLALTPRYGVRKELLAEIARLPVLHHVDGVQLDFEGPRGAERESLLSFVRELRAALPRGTALSLAIPARTADLKDAAFRYGDLGDIADRLFIMVYDQHWSGGDPGAVSALSWHKDVLRHARSRLPLERVVVGIPFYGRVWQHEKVAKALQHGKVEELLGEVSATVRRTGGDSPSFTFKKEVTGECWFEDAASLRAKLESAQALGFRNVGFWRIGQEDPRVWDLLERG